MQAIDLLTRDLWSYRPEVAGHRVYHWFNLLEACFWVLFAAIVLARFVKHRHSVLEVWYALAFLTFGLSDFREAYSLQPWLILAKGLNLAAIVTLRRIVLRRNYPGQRAF